MNKTFKKTMTVCAAAVLVLAGVLLGQLLIGNEAMAAPVDSGGDKNGTIEVVGTGSVKVKPDIAVLNIGVMTKGATTDVQNDNTKTMSAVLASVKALGIDEKDIKTVSYYMNPDYDYTSEKGANKIIGYTVYNMIEVKVRNINKAGEVLSAASDAGANVNNGISFTLSDVDTYYNQALTKAVANAKTKAKTIADAIGVSIGLPLTVSEGYTYYSAPYSNYNSMARNEADMAGAVSVSQGELEITANVSVSYAY